MKMYPMNPNDIPEPTCYSFKSTKNYKIITNFIKSDYDCVELVDHNWKTPTSAYTSLTKSCQRFDIHGVKVMTRGKRVFLLRVRDTDAQK